MRTVGCVCIAALHGAASIAGGLTGERTIHLSAMDDEVRAGVDGVDLVFERDPSPL
jgi:hypothetical protein